MMIDSGSLGFETIDAATFNEWGVDYLKYGRSVPIQLVETHPNPSR
jgi:hypothetical protein